MPKNRLKVMTVFGTRPEAIKMAPVVLELKKHQESIESIVVVTAQHRDMLDQVLQCFQIRPDYDLNMMKERQTLEEITTRGIGKLSALMKELQPDIVLVHGDTTTTFIASLAAFYNKIQIGHVEAGLRTGNKYSPYPEEMNRQLTGVLADLHFAPTNQAAENLILENKKSDSIYITGNTAIDALKTTVRKDYEHPILSGLNGDRMLLMTAHRRENIGKPMEEIFRSVKRLLEDHMDIQVVFPLHKNPVVREIAYRIFGETERLHLIEPLEVLDFHNFAAHAHLILTDSGGVQEEAPSLGVPVLVLRDTTERPEGIEAGTLLLAGIEEERIYQLATDLLTNEETYKKMATASNPYGDGFASKRIVEILLEKLSADNNKMINRPTLSS
ncbi:MULTISPECIES: non-hydrolyzing UDP-N-acetylglucosamine 2-epimerase [unclassified Peribacillus]|uniref:non-hydrolyzing UDP-N-acetylglucosamine 2-epimerase n=1 Tax=unclassified Peribacillus TaxID=2675266 RepID=UPI0019138A8E|nr:MULTISPECIES: UDP-N-acetylglucosamine 2-epimerase (non-hydrolyzing) [unclassified Peribacillus]MBK5443626.1 UDP-N-acetylglucosamine 2-epimerase (non-hydrolyzing) [Peribacillus sp. TH24]MBK5499792.1 UDP-N-acetylglucosamine 2-epimerase (non-hydrolyzing) [Peribacillus sp. TH14]